MRWPFDFSRPRSKASRAGSQLRQAQLENERLTQSEMTRRLLGCVSPESRERIARKLGVDLKHAREGARG